MQLPEVNALPAPPHACCSFGQISGVFSTAVVPQVLSKTEAQQDRDNAHLFIERAVAVRGFCWPYPIAEACLDTSELQSAWILLSAAAETVDSADNVPYPRLKWTLLDLKTVTLPICTFSFFHAHGYLLSSNL